MSPNGFEQLIIRHGCIEQAEPEKCNKRSSLSAVTRSSRGSAFSGYSSHCYSRNRAVQLFTQSLCPSQCFNFIPFHYRRTSQQAAQNSEWIISKEQWQQQKEHFEFQASATAQPQRAVHYLPWPLEDEKLVTLLSCMKGKAEIFLIPGNPSNSFCLLQHPTPCSDFRSNQMPNTQCQCQMSMHLTPPEFLQENVHCFLLKQLHLCEDRLNFSSNL